MKFRPRPGVDLKDRRACKMRAAAARLGVLLKRHFALLSDRALLSGILIAVGLIAIGSAFAGRLG